jgi:hypothetical protein
MHESPGAEASELCAIQLQLPSVERECYPTGLCRSAIEIDRADVDFYSGSAFPSVALSLEDLFAF